MCTRQHGAHDPFLMFRPSGLSDAQAVSLVALPSWPPPAASLSVGGTTPDIFVAAPRYNDRMVG